MQQFVKIVDCYIVELPQTLICIAAAALRKILVVVDVVRELGFVWKKMPGKAMDNFHKQNLIRHDLKDDIDGELCVRY